MTVLYEYLTYPFQHRKNIEVLFFFILPWQRRFSKKYSFSQHILNQEVIYKNTKRNVETSLNVLKLIWKQINKNVTNSCCKKQNTDQFFSGKNIDQLINDG